MWENQFSVTHTNPKRAYDRRLSAYSPPHMDQSVFSQRGLWTTRPSVLGKRGLRGERVTRWFPILLIKNLLFEENYIIKTD